MCVTSMGVNGSCICKFSTDKHLRAKYWHHCECINAYACTNILPALALVVPLIQQNQQSRAYKLLVFKEPH